MTIAMRNKPLFGSLDYLYPLMRCRTGLPPLYVSEWQKYFAELGKASGDRYVSLEFVRADDAREFKQDAAVLKKLIES
jgi:hypothetical protein